MEAIINQLFEIEQKLRSQGENIAERNLKRITHELEHMGYKVIDPMNRPYKETDTDVEASISGPTKNHMKITRVLKPIIYHESADGQTQLLQKGIVIVEAL